MPGEERLLFLPHSQKQRWAVRRELTLEEKVPSLWGQNQLSETKLANLHTLLDLNSI